jgi:hypothetical protein
MLDCEASRAVYWLPDGGSVPSEEQAGPFRTILHWWMALRDRQLLHAAAVGSEAGGALIVGRGGAGKSTTAVNCVQAGMRFAGDDYCLLGEGGAPSVLSLYSSAKLNDSALDRLDLPAHLVSNPVRRPDEKAVLFLGRDMPGMVAPEMRLQAVLVPQKVEGGSRAVRVPAAAALAALAPSTLLQLSGPREGSMRAMAALVRALPAYRLELGREPAGVVAAVRGVLQKVGVG